MNFQELEDSNSFDYRHNVYCPMAKKGASTLCMCRELDSADMRAAQQSSYVEVGHE